MNLGESINSPGDEITPFLQSDDTLYFASNGSGGRGGFDVFICVYVAGEWQPPLTPATITTVEIWRDDAWQEITLRPSPYGGYVLPGGTYRFTGTVGGGTVPAAVNEAFRRLAEYMAAKPGAPGTTRERVTAGSVTVDKSRSASWAASAMSNSGAGDLLRPYRRAS